jgi:hypothetical protein
MTETTTGSKTAPTTDLTVTVPAWVARDIDQCLKQTGLTLSAWLSRAVEERSALEISEDYLVGRAEDDITHEDERFAWASGGATGSLRKCAEMRRQMLERQEQPA